MTCPAGPALASGVEGYDADGADGGSLQPYLQCVPYAREVTGIQIHGDAWTWWGQAEGRYSRGHTPRAGAVMAFQPYGKMTLGHVAAVSRVIDSRTVLLRHANWSPIGGRRGQIEDDVEAVDVSPGNDWSQVRVWYAPTQDLGSTAWPVAGFIYPDRTAQPVMQLVRAEQPVERLARADRRDTIAPSRSFLKAFESFEPLKQVQLIARDRREQGKPVDLVAQVASR
jgi:surface antigen